MLKSYSLISESTNKCNFEYCWNTLSTTIGIIGFILGILLNYLKWLNSPLRISSYVIGMLFIIATITLGQWNRSLIVLINNYKNYTQELVTEFAKLQEKHSELSRQFENKVDRYENLNDRYMQIFVIMALLGGNNIDQILNTTKNNKEV